MRPKCSFENCINLSARRYSKKGKTYYRKYCWTHDELSRKTRKKRQIRRKWLNRMQRYGLSEKETIDLFKEIDNSKCSKCGWDRSYCDLHRITPRTKGGKYTKGNIMVLCPNCHREIHHKKTNKNPPFLK